jgi:hypothetical protein
MCSPVTRSTCATVSPHCNCDEGRSLSRLSCRTIVCPNRRRRAPWAEAEIRERDNDSRLHHFPTLPRRWVRISATGSQSHSSQGKGSLDIPTTGCLSVT